MQDVGDVDPVTFRVLEGGAPALARLLPSNTQLKVLTDSMVWANGTTTCTQELRSKLLADGGWTSARGFALKCGAV